MKINSAFVIPFAILLAISMAFLGAGEHYKSPVCSVIGILAGLISAGTLIGGFLNYSFPVRCPICSGLNYIYKQEIRAAVEDNFCINDEEWKKSRKVWVWKYHYGEYNYVNRTMSCFNCSAFLDSAVAPLPFTKQIAAERSLRINKRKEAEEFNNAVLHLIQENNP